MKKRNKIKLPSLKDEDVPFKDDNGAKLNVEMLQDDFNEEDPLPLVGGLKKMGQIPIETSEKTEEKHKYDGLFKKDVKVLNLENMDLDMDPELQPPESFQPKSNFREKDYVKLLDKEEKKQITAQIKKFGGDSDEDDALQEFEDDRLALSNREQKLQDARKKKLIQDVIAEDCQNEGSSREWEANLMNRVQIQRGPTLPPLYKGIIDGNALEQELSRVQQQKRQLKAKLILLQNQRHILRHTREELVTRIKQLGTY
ncbi:hypothetical protein ZYGR_0AD03890 [Zygosaccharomyces rouxii]|uniref:ZYRO0G15114p n=2 Tax=Zygosaccharomyces rouxii TaxID=4956 RepID=C5E0S1_ZYGRC|nr:uncharacterized protein ZYRO0G15114g [Zygosaccharomyces rouxii]KAH9202699.1 nineteen complex-related protein 2-domain-containing protein [Zygosaccharomyces rouxii]GAV51206.1 hypothetical protein ZYGR_0AD03890 [Zygosaccharomyces rouxii]CAR29705.1 ZYRO0G15114p [Zygosaccharomyces rouxii]